MGVDISPLTPDVIMRALYAFKACMSSAKFKSKMVCIDYSDGHAREMLLTVRFSVTTSDFELKIHALGAYVGHCRR